MLLAKEGSRKRKPGDGFVQWERSGGWAGEPRVGNAPPCAWSPGSSMAATGMQRKQPQRKQRGASASAAVAGAAVRKKRKVSGDDAKKRGRMVVGSLQGGRGVSRGRTRDHLTRGLFSALDSQEAGGGGFNWGEILFV